MALQGQKHLFKLFTWYTWPPRWASAHLAGLTSPCLNSSLKLAGSILSSISLCLSLLTSPSLECLLPMKYPLTLPSKTQLRCFFLPKILPPWCQETGLATSSLCPRTTHTHTHSWNITSNGSAQTPGYHKTQFQKAKQQQKIRMPL